METFWSALSRSVFLQLQRGLLFPPGVVWGRAAFPQRLWSPPTLAAIGSTLPRAQPSDHHPDEGGRAAGAAAQQPRRPGTCAAARAGLVDGRRGGLAGDVGLRGRPGWAAFRWWPCVCFVCTHVCENCACLVLVRGLIGWALRRVSFRPSSF